MSADLVQFVDGLLGSFGLVAQAVALGGIAFAVFVLGPWRQSHFAPHPAVALCLRLTAFGASATCLCALLQLAAKAQFISVGMNMAPFPELFHTRVFQVTGTRAALALLVAFAAFRLVRWPDSGAGWLALGVAAALLVLAGAWLTHGSARLERKEILMILTTLHLTAGAVWVGAAAHLVSLWRLGRRDASGMDIWPEAFARFAPLGAGALAVIFATGIPITLAYVDSWSGLAGSAYGSVLVAKWVLMAAALALAFANFRAGRRWRRETSPAVPRPYFAEVESLILVVVLFAASALAALPPAADITDQRASFAEVVESFAPKMPQITSPSLAEEQAASAESAVVARAATSAEEQWSDYNHNISGLILLAIALVALLERTGKASWARHWPLGFIVLAAFVLFRSDPSGWPLAPNVGLLESFGKASWIQHRVAGLIPIALGIMEWRARTVPEAGPTFRFALPVLSIAGGLLLLTHSHGAFELKAEYLTQVSHTAMGMLAVLMGCGRWLEIRVEGPAGRAAGIGAQVAMALLALILVFYREPLA
jgi:putative copper resistance protein D